MGKAGKRKQQLDGEESKGKKSKGDELHEDIAEEDFEGEVEEDDDEEIIDGQEEDEEEDEGPKQVWRPGIDTIEDGEQLDVEPGTYDMLHRAQVEWPCLSLDVIRDDLGASRSSYPMTAYIVAGSQAAKVEDNRIYVMKWSKLYKTLRDGREDEDSEDEDSGDDSEDEHEAVLESKAVVHPGAVNRVRSMPQAGHIVATWADTGKLHMWNLDAHRKALDKPTEKALPNAKPIFTCDAHKDEGFALDFSPHETGKFLSGSNTGQTFLWEPVAGGWSVGSDNPFGGHTSSVEDVQWKKTGTSAQHLFASCSSDGSCRVWDVREKNRKKSAVNVPEAHGGVDVNVLSWSPIVGELLVTGADDGGFKIWDTRNVGAGPMANFKWHRKPITSVDWHPTDETALAVASEDDCVSIWDMAVEDDAPGRDQVQGADYFPPQLLFVHQGQRDPKELRWHPQIPSVCVCTAATGFNVFKTCNV
eukprot:TRINITY_DN25426_c0_g1_i1.p1 TRINITY_DN25426_c0_g1~~TRINITY_DN25426_c0_g1_i1.p1  ORF type:complete len:473 (-),score=129.37 TRINITY_DN25426_c0_g1_i1:96-1514(-)